MKLKYKEKVCRVCKNYFDVQAAIWNYAEYWNSRQEDYSYELEYPKMDICDRCAIIDTENR